MLLVRVAIMLIKAATTVARMLRQWISTVHLLAMV